MKKRGSTLVVVLACFAALIITGTVVYSYVSSTRNTNENLQNDVNLETATYSASNIAEYYLINDGKYKEINEGKTIQVPERYLMGKFNKIKGDESIKEWQKLNNFKYDVKITDDGDSEYTINTLVKYNGKSKSKSSKIKINDLSENENINGEIDKFLNTSSGITILNNSIFQVNPNIGRIYNTTINIKDKENRPADDILKNDHNVYYPIFNKNNNNGGDRSNGLKLKFSKKNLLVNSNRNSFKIAEEKLKGLPKGAVVLLNNSNEKLIYNINDLKDDDFKEYIGAVVKLSNNKNMILINGNLLYDTSLKLVNTFVYVTDGIEFGADSIHIVDSNLVTGNYIKIKYNYDINGSFNIDDLKNEIKEYISYFVK